MRKRTINHLADTIFWYLLYFLPVLGFLIYLINGSMSDDILMTFENFCVFSGLESLSGGMIFITLESLFGVGGVLPLYLGKSAFYIFSWFVSTYLVHLAVDFLLFIPRLGHKYMKSFTQGE